jgi:hypothetical protein
MATKVYYSEVTGEQSLGGSGVHETT